jgi:hypothetical protein
MKKTLQLLLKLGLGLSLFMMFGVTAFAVSVYDVDRTTATVGTAQTYEIEYTIDTALQTWADADTLTVTLPSNFPIWDSLTYTVENDKDATNNATNETAITAGAGNGQFADDNSRVLTIKYNLTAWGAPNNGAETLRILITASAAPTYAGATSTITFGGTTVAGGDTNPSGTDTVNVSAADANASIVMADATAGGSGTMTITLTISSALANTDTITFTAPSVLDVSGLTGLENITGTLEAGGGAILCDDVGQVVTCGTDGIITAATGTLIIPAAGIKGAHVGTTDITNLEVNRVSGGAGGADINSDATVDVTDITVGDLTSTNVEPGILSLSTLSQNTISFTTTAKIPNLGSIQLTYPTDWNVAGANALTAGNLSGLDGTWTASVSGQTITLTQTGGGATAAGAKSFTLNNILTPPFTGSGGTYTITTRHTTGPSNIETNAAVTADTIIGKTVATVTIGKVTGVVVTDNTGGGVLVTWTDPSGDQSTHIKVMKGTDPLPIDGSPYATIEKGVKKFVDKNVKIGDKVSYILQAITSSKTGALTDAVTFVVGSSTLEEETEEAVAEGDEEVAEGTEEATGEEEEAVGEEETTGEEEVEGGAEEGLAEEEEATEEAPFADVATHWAKNYVTDLYTQNIVSGKDLTSFKPDDSITRAEFIKIVIGAFGIELKDAEDISIMPFKDVKAGDWFLPYAEAAKEEGIVTGYADGTFKPDATITRAEAMKILLEAAGADTEGAEESTFKDVSQGAWYAKYVNYAAENDIVKGYADGTFGVNKNITRAETAKIVSLMMAE